jgi:hypothetical protein
MPLRRRGSITSQTGYRDAIRERNRKAAEEAGAALLQERNRDPIERFKMVSFSWKIGGFGVVGSATVTIDNANDFPVKNVDVRCEFSGKSGTELSASQNTIFDTIAAKTKRTFKYGLSVDESHIDDSRTQAPSCALHGDFRDRFPGTNGPVSALSSTAEEGMALAEHVKSQRDRNGRPGGRSAA